MYQTAKSLQNLNFASIRCEAAYTQGKIHHVLKHINIYTDTVIKITSELNRIKVFKKP